MCTVPDTPAPSFVNVIVPPENVTAHAFPDELGVHATFLIVSIPVAHVELVAAFVVTSNWMCRRAASDTDGVRSFGAGTVERAAMPHPLKWVHSAKYHNRWRHGKNKPQYMASRVRHASKVATIHTSTDR